MDGAYILVVDDESRMRKLIKDFLMQKGYSILEAGDGEEAAQALDVPDTSPPFVNFCVFLSAISVKAEANLELL